VAKKKGKYDSVVDKLPRLANLEPAQVDKIENVKHQILAGGDPDAIKDLPNAINRLTTLFDDVAKGLIAAAHGKRYAATLAAGYAKVRATQDVLKEMDSILTIIEEAYQSAGIEQFEVEGATSSLVIPEGTVRHAVEPYAQVEDREAYRLWCIANGYERSLALAWQTTNSVTKERLTAGLPVPDGVKAFQKHKFVFTPNKELRTGEEFVDYVHPSEKTQPGDGAF
jgi:hypothetical protein